jgi:hypothetical protein
MSAWDVRTLGPADAGALSGLLVSARGVGPRIDRGPDPFAHPLQSGHPIHFGAFRDGHMVAAAGAVTQIRHIGGRPCPTVYVFDVRVAPEARGSLVLCRVLGALRRALAGESWCHAVVFAGHPRAAALARGLRWFDAARLLGRTRHVAWPVFLDAAWRVRRSRVEETDAEEAARAYFDLAPSRDMSPADESRFRAPGRFFVRRAGRHVVAVGKLVDETPSRRIVQDGAPPFGAAVLGLVARVRGFARLPRCGEPAALVYLAWYASSDDQDPMRLAIAAAATARGATHVCYGVDASLPPPAHPFAVHFVSHTIGYGAVPPSLAMNAHELTWM